MDLAARLDDVAAHAQDHLAILGSKADLAFQDDRVLILEGVDMRWYQRAHRERVLDDRERAAGVRAIDLEHHADTGRQSTDSAFARLDHLQSHRRVRQSQ